MTSAGDAGTGATVGVLDDSLLARLAPICRSITGDGVRATLRILQEQVPLRMVEVPTGTPILDWNVPQEWNLHDAYVADATGRRLIDVRASALHVVSYSEPVRTSMTFEALRPHLHTLPDRPTLVPYRTSYWNRTWGFCVAHDQLPVIEAAAAAGPLEVVIDSSFTDGSLTYGELVIPGRDDVGELVVSTHTCHPAMVNDNVTGMVALARIGQALLATGGLRHRVRLLWSPGTVGALTWLATHRDEAQEIRGGLVLTGLGDASALTYKSSRRGDTRMDRVARRVVRAADSAARFLPWDPYGYDERQFCSPGFDLAVGRLTRGVHGTYPEYHTSADDRSFVDPARIDHAIDTVLEILRRFDADEVVTATSPHGEPQLGRRGLYRAVGGAVDSKSVEMAYLWLLSLGDGDHSVDDVCEASGLAEDVVRAALDRLLDADLVTVAQR